jgi:death-on-curing protein
VKDLKYITVEQVIIFNQGISKSENATHSLTSRSSLESAVSASFYFQVDNGFIHGTIPEVAAALCYKIAKNHPFLDGNKRTAAIAALVFLELNEYNIEFEEYGDSDTEFSREIISFVENKTNLDDLKAWFIKKTSKRNK